MNPTGKKFISLFLVFFLLTINCASLRTTSGKERLGATLIITKKDGKKISGRLFAVKKDSLLLSPGKEVSIDIKDIEKIVVVKNSKVRLGVIIGGLTGAVAGGFISTTTEYWDPLIIGMYANIGGAIGILIGGVTGALLGIDKTIQIEGMTDSKIQKTLDYLRKQARIRDYN
jgi:hypothetical protein